jgi:predicted ATP-binding protein involved in virulence
MQEAWGDSGRLTYHNPQTKKVKSSYSHHRACKSIITDDFSAQYTYLDKIAYYSKNR